jgi:hypothetical protein
VLGIKQVRFGVLHRGYFAGVGGRRILRTNSKLRANGADLSLLALKVKLKLALVE